MPLGRLTFDLLAMVRDGALLSVLASTFIMTALRLEPRLFLRHFPEEIKAAAQPLSRRAQMAGRLLVMPPFLALLIAGPWLSARSFATVHPEAGFAALALHAFSVAMIFNLVDWLVLDELWLGVIQPRWALPRGAEGVPFRFNHLHHARGFVVGAILAAVMSALVAAVLVTT